jgi:stage V sporulation protein B
MENQSITKGAAILSVAGILVKILSILYMPILILIFHDTGNKLYGTTYNIYAFIYIITNSGIPVALSKFVAELRVSGNYKDAVKAFKISRFFLLIIGLIFATLLSLFSVRLANFFSHPEIYLALIALSPTLIFTCVTSAYRGYFQGSSNMTPTAISQIIEQVINILISLPFAYVLLGPSRDNLVGSVAGATLGTSAGALVAVFILVWFYKKDEFSRLQEYVIQRHNPNIARLSYKQICKKLLQYSIPVTICVGMQNAGNMIDLYQLIPRLMAGGISAYDAGILQSYLFKSQQLINVPVAIIVSLSIALLPAISAAVVSGDSSSVREKINYAFRLCFIVSLPAMIGFAAISKSIYIVFYYQGYGVLLFGSVIVVLMSVVQIQASVLQGMSKLYAVTIFITLGMTVKVITNFFLLSIPAINIYGTIIGSALGYLISIYLSNRLMKKVLKVKFSIISHTLKPLFSSAIMGAVVFGLYNLIDIILKINTANGSNYFANILALLICVCVGGIVYFVAMAKVGGITKEDVEAFPSRIRRFIPKLFIRLMR